MTKYPGLDVFEIEIESYSGNKEKMYVAAADFRKAAAAAAELRNKDYWKVVGSHRVLNNVFIAETEPG